MRTNNAQLTVRVCDLVDVVASGQRIEDANVEAKADWIDPKQAARQLSAHANSARGEDILWILGLKEGRGVVELTSTEPAAWFAQVASHFDGPAPRPHDLEVSTESGKVRAILFSTSDPPYVIAARPSEGRSIPEILFRESTGVRYARREELLRILIAKSELPHVEALGCTLLAHDRPGPQPNMVFNADFYFTPATSERIVLPLHRQRGSLRAQGIDVSFDEFELSRPLLSDNFPHLQVGDSEIVLTGPTKVGVHAMGYFPVTELRAHDLLQAQFEFQPAMDTQVATLSIPLTFAPNDQYPCRYVLTSRPWE